MAMRPIAVNVPPELLEEIRAEATKEHRSFAYIVREALVLWLDKRKEAAR
jgi:Arc/MetJ-type ribon-helix-helix transcriptional regulator